MHIAPEGWPFIHVAFAVDAALLMVWYAWPGAAVVLPVIGLLLTVWLFVFFRDPVREGPRGDQLVVSPADGKVISVAPVDETMYLHSTATRISIFMNVFNVHVNRYPVSGEIEIVHYNPGEFLVASEEKASLVNEQASVGILGPRGQLLVRQIAGMVARRIVTDGNPGDTVRQGERLGMIRFGSRVDVFLEPGAAVQVQVGQKVHAGLTVLAEYAT
ncbi:MAG: phosphatidylserine decarboxylase [Gemmatimonadetes bacterium GWC2_71_10]|nr:MAG: phosphatidylserine decarboxylase [Gemmatimonadetes bacterium GWC2_71_10]